MPAEKKLKPCPFCGCREIITYNAYGQWVTYCDECGSSTAYFDIRAEAEKAWNERVTNAQVEKLKDENRALRDELRLRCGLSRQVYKGACEDCSWKRE